LNDLNGRSGGRGRQLLGQTFMKGEQGVDAQDRTEEERVKAEGEEGGKQGGRYVRRGDYRHTKGTKQLLKQKKKEIKRKTMKEGGSRE